MVTDTIKINKNCDAQTPHIAKPVLNAVKVGVVENICRKCGVLLKDGRRLKNCNKCQFGHLKKNKNTIRRKHKRYREKYRKELREKNKLWRKTVAGKKYLHEQYLKHKHKSRIYMREYMRKKRGSVVRNNEGELIIYRKKFKLKL